MLANLLKKEELRTLCRARKLPVSGTKAILADLLLPALLAAAQQPELPASVAVDEEVVAAIVDAPQGAQSSMVVEANTFFAQVGCTFADLGLSEVVSACAQRSGFVRPSRMQQLSIPDLLRLQPGGKAHDSVITGETGSGKTIAYLLPLLHHLLRHEEDAVGAEGVRALILCPSQVLCNQVHEASLALLSSDSSPLVRTTNALDCLQLEPVSQPEIIVGTPSMLLKGLERSSSPLQLATFGSSVRHLVLDEADVLLAAGYDLELRRLLHLLAHGTLDGKVGIGVC